ncbi:hypothetical protein Tco_0780197 [Tanacetum coccineum]
MFQFLPVLQQLQPEWSRFVTIVKQAEKIDIVSYHRLFDILKQFQLEVNDIRSERIAKTPKPQRSNATSSSTRQSTSTRHKGKEVAKPITPQSESVSEEDSDPEQAQRDKEMQKNLALLAKYFKKLYKPTNNNLRTSSNSRNKTEDTTPSKGYGATMQRSIEAKAAEQADWLEDTDEEIDEQELEAHYSYMAKIQEVSPEESSSTGQPLEQIVQLILFIVDSGCTKHMTGNLKLLCNFVEKFLGTVRFGNDQFAPILGYGDLNQGNVMIKWVYYVEGLNHNLFSVGQFCDADLEVAFKKSTCFVRDL